MSLIFESGFCGISPDRELETMARGGTIEIDGTDISYRAYLDKVYWLIQQTDYAGCASVAKLKTFVRYCVQMQPGYNKGAQRLAISESFVPKQNGALPYVHLTHFNPISGSRVEMSLGTVLEIAVYVLTNEDLLSEDDVRLEFVRNVLALPE